MTMTDNTKPEKDSIEITDTDGKQHKIVIKTQMPTVIKLEILNKTVNMGLIGTAGFYKNWLMWNRRILEEAVLEPAEYTNNYKKFEELYDDEYGKIIKLLDKYYNMSDFLQKSAILILEKQRFGRM